LNQQAGLRYSIYNQKKSVLISNFTYNYTYTRKLSPKQDRMLSALG